VTATPVGLATIIAQRLKLTGALGTVAETASGRYTGRLVGEVLHGAAKARAVAELAAREGLDLSRCAAYSDSINDIPLLSLVGRPVAVNPDSALRSEARSRGWEIRDFRTGRRVALLSSGATLGAAAMGAAVGVGIGIGRRQERNRAAALAARSVWRRSAPRSR
jgi:phosphoserine phosphatase